MPFSPEYVNFLLDNALTIFTLIIISMALMATIVKFIDISKKPSLEIVFIALLALNLIIFATMTVVVFVLGFLPQITSKITPSTAIFIIWIYIGVGFTQYMFTLFALFTWLKTQPKHRFLLIIVLLTINIIYPLLASMYYFIITIANNVSNQAIPFLIL